MSKKTHRLHYVIQGALIALSVAALLLLRQLLIHNEDIRAVFVYADIVLMVFVVSSVILVDTSHIIDMFITFVNISVTHL